MYVYAKVSVCTRHAREQRFANNQVTRISLYAVQYPCVYTKVSICICNTREQKFANHQVARSSLYAVQYS